MNSWVIVASAARARVFALNDRREPWQEVLDLVNGDDRLLRQDFVSDRPGRVIDRARGQHHTLTPSADPHEAASVAFAADLVTRLEDALHSGQFDRLTVVAPPHFLGLLRGRMGDRLRLAIHEEVNKDLTREDAATLRGHVEALALP